MAEIKIKGDISGSTTIKAPDSGSDEVIELSTALASKLDTTTAASSYLPISGGKILQIVRATDSTTRTTSSTSLVDASISVTITPQKADSVVLLIWSYRADTLAGGRQLVSAITDSSHNAISGAEGPSLYDAGDRTINHQTVIGYATPATTSAVTYKGRFRSGIGTVDVTIVNSANTGQLYAIEVSA